MRNYCLHGGMVPPEYLEVVLRREGQLAPLAMAELTVERSLEILACLAGEASAKRALQETSNGNP